MSKSMARYPLVTTRIGITFVVVCLFVAACAIAVTFVGHEPRFHSLLWITSLAACTLGGVVAMNSARSLRMIESELRRLSTTVDDENFDLAQLTLRPIIGSDPVNQSWNDLTDQLAARIPSSEPARTTVTLDQEVVTLARAMRGLPIAWMVTENDGSVRFAGPAACGMLCIEKDEDPQQLNVIDLLRMNADSDAQTISGLLSPVRLVMQNHRIELEDGPLDLKITRSRLTGRTGDSQGFVWVFTDVTQQQAATDARDQFLMTATHELRMPLSNLQAYAEALIDEEELAIEAQKEFCNTINSEANRLGRLIDQLLTVSQMEAGSMTANLHELEVFPILEQVVDQSRGQAEQKQIDLKTQFSAKIPTMIGDRDKLQAALMNLIGNAIKYTPAGGEVMVQCVSDEETIRIAVEDTGPGIPAEECEKVFEKFYRGTEVAQSDQRGNGLGLAFAREVAKLHGGDIELESTLGSGSTFTLSVPTNGQSRSGI